MAKANFELLGWGAVENTTHDLGTDLFLMARDNRRFDLGLLVGAQVKNGPSWFRNQPAFDDAGRTAVHMGWELTPDGKPDALLLRGVEVGPIAVGLGKGQRVPDECPPRA